MTQDSESPQAVPTDSQEGQIPPSHRDPASLAGVIEAALISTDKPLSAVKLAELAGGATSREVATAIETLNDLYAQSGRAFSIEQLAGGWQIFTRPEHAGVISALHKARAQTKLSPAAIETLAIIAYKQPVLRADIEAIRGVASGEMIRTLMERRLVKITGRAEEIGRPMLYGTTRTFLEVFGLASLKDLPRVEDFSSQRKSLSAAAQAGLFDGGQQEQQKETQDA